VIKNIIYLLKERNIDGIKDVKVVTVLLESGD